MKYMKAHFVFILAIFSLGAAAQDEPSRVYKTHKLALEETSPTIEGPLR